MVQVYVNIGICPMFVNIVKLLFKINISLISLIDNSQLVICMYTFALLYHVVFIFVTSERIRASCLGIKKLYN